MSNDTKKPIRSSEKQFKRKVLSGMYNTALYGQYFSVFIFCLFCVFFSSFLRNYRYYLRCCSYICSTCYFVVHDVETIFHIFNCSQYQEIFSEI